LILMSAEKPKKADSKSPH